MAVSGTSCRHENIFAFCTWLFYIHCVLKWLWYVRSTDKLQSPNPWTFPSNILPRLGLEIGLQLFTCKYVEDAWGCVQREMFSTRPNLRSPFQLRGVTAVWQVPDTAWWEVVVCERLGQSRYAIMRLSCRSRSSDFFITSLALS